MIHSLALLLILMSTLITITALSPLMAWLGLELNTFSIIPLMKNKNNISSHEGMCKYFLIHSITSTLFLVPTLYLHYFSYNLPSFSPPILTPTTVMTFALLTKLTLAPFHFWMFPLIKSIPWLTFMLLMTWQKIAPLFLIPYLSSKLTSFCILSSILLPPILSMNQNSTKTILAYASITHMAWLLTITPISTILLWMYLITYITNFFPIFHLLSLWNLNYIPQTTLIPPKFKLLLFLMMLSLSGLPPLMMFMTKTILILQLLQNKLFYPSILLLLASLSITYTYIYINFPLLFYNPHPSPQLLPPPPNTLPLLVPLLSIPVMLMLII